MKFTDPMPFVPKKIPPKNSWWAEASAQVDRCAFAKIAHDEQNRITGASRFQGRTHNKKEPKKCLHCDQSSRRRGMCAKHYHRWKKYGDATLTKIRVIQQGFRFKLERDDHFRARTAILDGR